MYLEFPFQLDLHGRLAEADDDAHIRQLIEQVLFTAPGQRVNRPNFGCGIIDLVFAPAADELASATQYLVRESLQRWLGKFIVVGGVEVESDDGTLIVTVRYRLRASQALLSARFAPQRQSESSPTGALP